MERKLKKIREAVHDDFLIKKNDRWKKIELVETNQAKCKSVLLKTTGIKTVVIELDKQGKDIHPLFSTEKGIIDLKIKNDYLIFALNKNKLYALLIELKSNNEGNWRNQCKAGEIVAKYILQMVNNWATDIVLEVDNFNFRYILFHTNESSSFKNKRKKNTRNSFFQYNKHPKEEYFSGKLMCNKEYNLGMFCK